MNSKIAKVGSTVAVLAAVAVGASAIAGAATDKQATTSSTASSQTQSQAPAAAPGRDRMGPGNHKPETALTGDTAASVKEAALAKVPGTIERVETDSDHGSPYEAHVRKSDGTEVEVLVNKQFKVTDTNTMGPRR